MNQAWLLGPVEQKEDADVIDDIYPFNILFKRNPMADWEHWMYLPPSDATIKILKREVVNTIAQMKEDGVFRTKGVCSVFFGIPVYAFQFLDGREVYLDQ